MTTTPKPVNLNWEKANALLDRAVAEKGEDYVYPLGVDGGVEECVYFDSETGAPSCIVGHVLAYEGMTLDYIHELNEGTTVRGLLEYADGCPVLEIDDDSGKGSTLELLASVQIYQDKGVPWGESVRQARRMSARRDGSDD